MSTYTALSSKIASIVRKHWHILKASFSAIPEFPISPIMSYRRSTSLKDRLIKSEITPIPKTKQTFLGKQRYGSYPCLNCINCRMIVKGDTFIHPSNNLRIQLKHYLTCTADWVIYILWCPCGLVYVGETTWDLKTKFNNNLYTIGKKLLDLPVFKHCTELGHTEWDFKCMVVDHVLPLRRRGDCTTLLKKQELQWIFRLDSLRPNGLNVEFETYAGMFK